MNLVGPRVFARRVALRLTQDAVCARIAGITEAAWNPDRREVFRIENGRRTVTDLELNALAQALDCSPGWLLLGDEALRLKS